MQREKEEKNQTKKKQKEIISKNKRDNLWKKEKGITLIALVVTIIVLLILAGVTIATLVGDNGILTEANKAVQTNEEAEEKERISLAWQSLYMRKVADNDNAEITGEEMEEQLIADGMTGVEATGSGTITVTVTHPEGDNVYTIDENGNINKKEENKWRQEEDGTITDGEHTLSIGDYVAYDEQTGETKAVTSYATDTGYSTDQTFTLSNYTKGWRVLGIDEGTGEIQLVAEDVIVPDGGSWYYLTGQKGYQNGVNELNKISEMFGHGNGATGGRSITVEDVNKITGYNPEEEKYGDGQIYEYGNKVTYYWQGTNYPYYEAEDTEGNKVTGSLGTSHSSSFNWYDEETGEWKSSERSTTATSENKEEITTLTSDYYNYTGGNGLSTSSKEYQTLFSGLSKSYYWLASPYVNARSGSVYFGLRHADTNGYVGGSGLYGSYGGAISSSGAVRPVVSLRSDISIVGGDGSQGEGAYQIQ